MEIRPGLNPASEVPLYRQLSVYLHRLIESGELRAGDRLPPTRELAGQLGLNRTTVSAAYELLETHGLIKGEVGRGSYVSGAGNSGAANALRTVQDEHLKWSRLLTPSVAPPAPPAAPGVISFTNSRPSDNLFPIEEFRASCLEVLASPNMKALLQLGSPGGYEPLRRFLLDRAVAQGVARVGDDILITNGCQQALDLLRRSLVRPGDKVAMEDPVYPGLRNLFLESGAELIGIPVGRQGLDPVALQRAFDAGARLVVVTPSFQNPTGATIPADHRVAICSMARAAGAAIIENDIYSELSCALPDSRSPALPRLKKLDGNVILLGSFSKVAFPGVRVGWIIGPRPVIARATELKQLADLHTDHLSQAFLLHFAQSGRLAAHEAHVLEAAREKLRALEESCRSHLSDCTWNIPSGGMNIWIGLPAGLDAVSLRGLAQQAGIDYLPGRYFAVSRAQDSGLRLSFAGLEPGEIREGIRILGSLIQRAVGLRGVAAQSPALAMV